MFWDKSSAFFENFAVSGEDSKRQWIKKGKNMSIEDEMGATPSQEVVLDEENLKKEGENPAEGSVEEASGIEEKKGVIGGLKKKIGEVRKQRKEIREGEEILDKEEKEKREKEREGAKERINSLFNKGDLNVAHHDIRDLAEKYGFEEYVIKKFSSIIDNLIEIRNSNMSQVDKSIREMRESVPGYKSLGHKTEEDRWIGKLENDISSLEYSLGNRSKKKKKI